MPTKKKKKRNAMNYHPLIPIVGRVPLYVPVDQRGHAVVRVVAEYRP